MRRSSLVQRVKKQRIKYISILPNLITLLNAVCGFVAIGFTVRGSVQAQDLGGRPALTYFALAGYMIFLAMVADMLDGRVARLSKSTSSFGGQLDSLSDAISFGVAPALLMIKLFENKLMTIAADAPTFVRFAGRFGAFCAVIYVCCTIIRLARFNVENEEDESSHMSFSGLPSPAAAGAVVSLVILQQDFLAKLAARTDLEVLKTAESIIPWSLPFVALVAAFLMVSRVRYPHVVNQQFRGKKPFSSFIFTVLALVFILWNIQLTLAAMFCGFMVWGFMRWIFLKLTGKLSPQTPQTASEATDSGKSEG